MDKTPMPHHWFDAHLDLAYIALAGRDMLAAPDSAGGENLPGCVTFPSLRKGQVKWALATIFTEAHAPHHPYGYGKSSDIAGAHAAGVRQLELYQLWEKEGHLRIIRTAAGLDTNPSADAPLQVILLMECADPIASVDQLAWWHERGVRIVGLAWTHGSRYAAGNGVPSAQGGLTEAGRALVKEMDQLGMVHDLTHLNDAAAHDLLAMSQGNIIATHSASRTLQRQAITPVKGVDPVTVAQRHISDELLAGVRERGGMVGLPLYSRFLVEPGQDRPTLGRVAEHLDTLATHLGSRQHVGIGSDFDGGFSALQTPVGVEGPTKLENLANTLSRRGWSDAEITGLACGNWLRCFAHVLQ